MARAFFRHHGGLLMVAAALALASLGLAVATEHSRFVDLTPKVLKGNILAHIKEIDLYRPHLPAIHLPKGFDATEPSKAAHAGSNMASLVEVLGDAEWLKELKAEAHRLCTALHSSSCGAHFRELKCEALTLSSMRDVLLLAERRITSTAPNCVEYIKSGMRMFDLVAISVPLSHFQSKRQDGPKPALAALFEGLGAATPSGAPREEHSAHSTLELKAKKKSKKNKNAAAMGGAEEATGQQGMLAKVFHSFPSTYIGFAGSGSPLASLAINWFYQAYARFGELFLPSETKRRPFVSLFTLMVQGPEQRMTHIYRMCARTLGTTRKSTVLPPNILFAPRDGFTTESKLIGMTRISCDFLLEAAYTLNLADRSAIDRANYLMKSVPSANQGRTVPLEQNAGGVVNYHRLCLSFRRELDPTMLANLQCAFKDTVLRRLEAESEGEAPQSTAFVEAATAPPGAAATTDAMGGVADENAELIFDLISLRAGDMSKVAKLLGSGSDAWWTLLLMLESRTANRILKDYRQSVKVCQGVSRKRGFIPDKDEQESIQCDANWQRQQWEDQLGCKSRLLPLQCSALSAFHHLFNEEMLKPIEELLMTLSKESACGKLKQRKSCPKKTIAKQSPFAVIESNPEVFFAAIRNLEGGENVMRVFLLLSGNHWKTGNDIIKAKDGIDAMLQNGLKLLTRRQSTSLLSRWMPRTFKKLAQVALRRKYSKKHLQLLVSKLPSDFFTTLRDSVKVLAHPVAFVHVNQLNFQLSEPSGERRSAGGLSAKLDMLLMESATNGLPQTLKTKIASGAKVSATDYSNVDFSKVPPPTGRSWHQLLSTEIQAALASWLLDPANHGAHTGGACGKAPVSNVQALIQDSFDLVANSKSENVYLVGRITSPSMTATGMPGRARRLLKKLFRLPPYKAQHYTFAAVSVDIHNAFKAIQTMFNAYLSNKDAFENREVFTLAANDMFKLYEQRFRSPSRGLLGVPASPLVPTLHPLYAKMNKQQRLKELQESTMEQFFAHIWVLCFSVLANSMLNADNVDSLEKMFSKEAWKKSVNDPWQASSFGMILMGGDLGMQFYEQLLPTEQKRALKRSKYGSPTLFTSQMQLTGDLLSASGHEGLGSFLHSQSVYFGVMIQRWIQKRTSDRIREIISWLTLGLFFATSFTQVAQEVSSVANETGNASLGSGCGPMGICLDDMGNAFVPDPSASPAATALQLVLKTSVMASIGVFAGPAVAAYNILVSNFRIVSRFEMAVTNASKQLINKLAKSKTIESVKNLFKTKQDKAHAAEARRKSKSLSLGDEEDLAVSSFFEFHPHMCRGRR